MLTWTQALGSFNLTVTAKDTRTEKSELRRLSLGRNYNSYPVGSFGRLRRSVTTFLLQLPRLLEGLCRTLWDVEHRNSGVAWEYEMTDHC